MHFESTNYNIAPEYETRKINYGYVNEQFSR